MRTDEAGARAADEQRKPKHSLTPDKEGVK